ncbi:MAG TPA: ATP phosphoribosyltransferase regulatory subunit, partial [Pyrinomonadaceae bacterium]|nr:ATP phosphoribosyltransferase regulatory subunit [Pyrinomonadaceae bacterium]
MSKTNPARGTRDFLPADVRKREYVIGVIKEVYERYGFEPLETPAVENIETLMGKYGEEGSQLVFKILNRGDAFAANLRGFAGVVRSGTYGPYEENDPSYSSVISRDFCDLALRYDLTVPLARVVANRKNDIPKFFKRYQIQPVWRADRPAKGRFREFYQCDVDAIGSPSMVVEAELISAASEILTRLGFGDFIVRINHREILTDIL